MTTTVHSRASRLLPPKALLLAVAAQLPLALAALPLRPSRWELLVGIACVAFGAASNVWAERLFRRHGVGVCPFSPAPMLVRTGPYRFSRNPMYVGLVAIALGLAIASGVPGNAWSAVALFIWLHHACVLPEEAFLRETFGEAAFEAYARAVPRWLLLHAS